MRSFALALALCLFAAACSQESTSESLPGTYTLDKEQLEANLVEQTMQGEEMQRMLDTIATDKREEFKKSLAEDVRQGMGQNINTLDWTLYLQEDGTFAMTSTTDAASQRDSTRGTWQLASDTLLTLKTTWHNGQSLSSDTTRQATYRDDTIYMEDDRMVPGLRVAMNKQ